MDDQNKREIGSPSWFAQQRAICNQAIALEDGAPPASIPLLKLFAQDEITMLDMLEAAYAEAERLTIERNAAVNDLLYVANGGSHCDVCAHVDDGFQFAPPHCKYINGSQGCFEWIGPCAQNTPDAEAAAKEARGDANGN